jgi:hypothetical protein
MRKKANTTPAPEQGAVQPAVAENRDAQHHPCGPSKWPALLECPCFQSRQPTEDTKRGTELHALFEAVLKGTYKGEPVDAMEKHVVNAARKLQEGANTGHFHVEELVELPPPSDSPSTKCEFYGRLDLGWRNWDTGDLHVADLKLSENPDRDHRAQLLGYAAGIMRRLKYTPTLVYLHVAYADTGNITQEVMAGDEAWAEYNANYRRIEPIWKGTTPLSPRQCGWCDLCANFTACPAMNAVVEKASPRLADAAKPERWADFTSKQKAQACALADTLAKWCEAVKENAAADAKAGELIEDPEHCIWFGLQERRGRFVIPDVQAAWEILKPHLTAERYRACLSANQTELKAALKQAGVKLSDINALVERCGTRLPSTTVFIRKGLKESA